MLLVNLFLWMALAVLVSVATRVDYDDNFLEFPKIVKQNSKESKYAEVQDVMSNDIKNDMNFKVKYVPWFQKSTKVLPLERQRANSVKKFRTSPVDDMPKYIIEYVDGRVETYSQRPNDSPSTRSPVMYNKDEFLDILGDPKEDLPMATEPKENIFNFEADDDLNIFKDWVFNAKEDLKESILPKMEEDKTYMDDNSQTGHYGIIKEILKLKTSSKELVNFGYHLDNLVMSVTSQNLHEVYEGELGANTDFSNDKSSARPNNQFAEYSENPKDYSNQDVPKVFGSWKQFLDKPDIEEDFSYTKYEPHFFIVFPHRSKSFISSSMLGSNIESPDIRGTDKLPSFVSVFEERWRPLIHVKPEFQEKELKTYLTVMEQLFAKAGEEMKAGCHGQSCLSTDDKVDSLPALQDNARTQEANANMNSNENINATVTAKSEEETDFASSDKDDKNILPNITTSIKANLHFLLNGNFLVEEADRKNTNLREDSQGVPPGEIHLSASKEHKVTSNLPSNIYFHTAENEGEIDLASNDQSDSSITQKNKVRIAVGLHFLLNGGFMADLMTSDTREAIPRVPEREIYPDESETKAKAKNEPTATSNLASNLDFLIPESEDDTDFIFEDRGDNSISQNSNVQVAVNLQIKLNGSVLPEVADLLTSDIEEESHPNEGKSDSNAKTKTEYTGYFNFPSNLDSFTAESEEEEDFTSKYQSKDSIPQNSNVKVAVNRQFKFNGNILPQLAELFTSGIQEDVHGVPQRDFHHEEDESLSRDYEDYSWLFNFEEDLNRVEEKHTKNRIYQHPSTGIVYGMINLKSPVSLDLEQPMSLYDTVKDSENQDELRPRSVIDTILLSDFFGNLDNSQSPLSNVDSLTRSLAGSYGWAWKNTGNGRRVYPRTVKFSSLDTQNSLDLDYEAMSYGTKNAYSKLTEQTVKYPSPTAKRRWHSGLAPNHLDEL